MLIDIFCFYATLNCRWSNFVVQGAYHLLYAYMSRLVYMAAYSNNKIRYGVLSLFLDFSLVGSVRLVPKPHACDHTRTVPDENHDFAEYVD